jgi:hypothetical protein
MKKYKFGFEYKGLISFLLVMIPNFIWMTCPPLIDPLVNMIAPSTWLYILMNVSQWSMIMMICVLVRRRTETGKSTKFYLVFAKVCLIVYYLLWIGYYSGFTNRYILLGMAWFPSLLFIFVGLWLKNYWALIPSTIFLCTHIFITWYSFYT